VGLAANGDGLEAWHVVCSTCVGHSPICVTNLDLRRILNMKKLTSLLVVIALGVGSAAVGCSSSGDDTAAIGGAAGSSGSANGGKGGAGGKGGTAGASERAGTAGQGGVAGLSAEGGAGGADLAGSGGEPEVPGAAGVAGAGA